MTGEALATVRDGAAADSSDAVRVVASRPPLTSVGCILPWINLHVSTDGVLSPCCEFKGGYGHLSKDTMQSAWQSPALAAIREAFLQGRALPGCQKCVDREAHEGSSLRLESNQRFADAMARLTDRGQPPAFPTALDLRFSNLCNFKCRSCWHGASSKWFADGQAIGLIVSDRPKVSSFSGVDDFLAQVAPGLDQVEDLYFAGGEPLLMPEHFRLLERLIEIGKTDLVLRYNSNLSVTTFKGRSMLALWAQFPHIELHASVDAAGALGAYLRSGFDWNLFVDNVQAVRAKCPHVKIRFGITVSALNVLRLVELFEALEASCQARVEDFFLHSLQDPLLYRTQILPKKLKRLAATRLEEWMLCLARRTDLSAGAREQIIQSVTGVIQYMMAQELPGARRQFVKRTRQLDRLRDENGADVLNELGATLKRPRFFGRLRM